MENTYTSLALNFLCRRNPFDDTPHNDFVFSLMNYQDKKGDEAVEALAGFYLYAIRNIGGQKGSEAIATTFAHDINGANDYLLEPKSISYRDIWTKECDQYGWIK